MVDTLLEYGPKGNSKEIYNLLTHILDINMNISNFGQKPTPVCIWGTHGLGKTDMVKDYANNRNWKFRYIAPAQFEEMGDLHGMPYISENKDGSKQTIYSAPDWVPTEEGPGILLIDDMNRADDRILRGCMQLLQNYELASWKLPPKWQIVVTANPEGGDYSVTPMDEAMLTRMIHTTMKFDAKVWAEWATSAGIDPRGISFVLTYPELINSSRTTPRSITQFFNLIRNINDLKQNLELVYSLALSSIDEITANSFISFINDDLSTLIEPSDILDATDFNGIKKKIVELSKDENGGKRLDRLSTICTRLYLHLLSTSYNANNKHGKNLVSFLLIEEIPNDLLMSLYMDLSKNASDEIKSMLRDKTLAQFLINSM